MAMDKQGNITLNRASYYSFSIDLEEEDGSKADVRVSDIKLYVSRDDLLTADPLFVVTPFVDPAVPSELHFTFTTEHARQIGKKEYVWIIREVVAGVPDVAWKGGKITAEGFAV